ncbi:hypothetical protein FACS189476_06240 [Spirochaetia bacterium]|nr:hypothetical protein FACS189476_06240 [Spirochaetia bacterium]
MTDIEKKVLEAVKTAATSDGLTRMKALQESVAKLRPGISGSQGELLKIMESLEALGAVERVWKIASPDRVQFSDTAKRLM